MTTPTTAPSRASDEEIHTFKTAVLARDPDRLRRTLSEAPRLTALVNEPLFHFDTPAIVVVRDSPAVVDALLEHGADINIRSQWWAGGFGVLDGASAEVAEPLIQRGAVMDVHAAAALGRMDRLRELVEADPSLVNARGGDGQTPLHFASTPEVMDYLLAHGADINARDVDHLGTPAQYAIDDPACCRALIERGADVDIFMAIQLGDVDLVRRVLAEDPGCVGARINSNVYPPCPEAPGAHIYVYKIDGAARPLPFAAKLGHQEIVDLLLEHATPVQRLLFACARADAAAVQATLAERPDIVSTLAPEDMALITEAAWRNDIGAVRVMLDAGFDINARGVHDSTPLDRAATCGYVDVVRLLLERGASLDVRNEFGGTPLGAAIWGSVNFTHTGGDHAATVEALLAAGAPVPETADGSDAVAAVFRRHGSS